MANVSIRSAAFMLASAIALMPVTSSAQVYSFEQAVQTALQSNPETLVGEQRVMQAQAALAKADASRLPQINLSITGSYSNNPLNVFGMKLQQRDVVASDMFGANFDTTPLNEPDAHGDINTRLEVMIPVWNGGKISAYQAQAAEMIKAAQQGNVAVQQYITFNVYQAYEAVHAARAFIKVAEQAKKTADEFVRTTQSLLQQGVVVKSELLNAQANQSAAEVQLAKAKGQEQIALDSLKVMMNLPADAMVDVAERNDLSMNAVTLQEAVSQALSNNPVLAAKRQQAFASKHEVDVARAEQKPSFNMMVRQEFNDQALDFGSSSYTVAGVFSWKLMDLSVGKGSIAMATAAAAEQEAVVKSEENKVRLAVMTAWQNLKVAHQQVTASQLTVAQAEEALYLMTKRYKNGVSTLTEVLASQTRLDKARADLVSAQFQVNVQKATLRLNTGVMELAQL